MAAPNPADAGIIELTAGELLAKRLGLGLSFGLVSAGAIMALAHLVRSPLETLLIGGPIFLLFYSLEAIGMTVGFHRLFSHRSFACGSGVKAFLIICGSVSMGSVLDWAADHRRHHRYSDKAGDVHSPFKFASHTNGANGFGGRTPPPSGARGFLHAHIGWLFDREKTDYAMYIPDLLRDPVTVGVGRLYLLWVALSYALSALLGLVIGGDGHGALLGFLWGGCMAPWSVMISSMSLNSVCHLFGRRTFVTGDYSVNNRLIALSGFGEGWHNNHHAFPFSARFGIESGQLDVGFLFIRLLEKLGLVWRVKQPGQNRIAAKARTADIAHPE